MNDNYDDLVTISGKDPVWEKFFTVYPLVIIGTREAGGEYNLAPKHLAIPLSWQNHFGFVCTPTHRTYHNIREQGEFTVSYPRPEQIVFTSLTASPRCEDDHKPIVDVLPTFKANEVDSLFIKDAYLYLECKLDRIIDGFGKNSLITGTISRAHASKSAMRHSDRDDNDVIHSNPLLAYIYPGRFTIIEDTQTLPFPDGFKR
jgi:flavin reductase (DIM6/NTAB) family NADH-FMN oxidoreductase RutF